MERREYLATVGGVGALTALTGCIGGLGGGGSGDGGNGSDGGDSSSPDPVDEEVAIEVDTNVEVTEQEYNADDDGMGGAVRGRVVNADDGVARSLVVTVDFAEDDGIVVASDSDSVDSLVAGVGWGFNCTFEDVRAERISRYRIRVTETEA